MVDTSPWRPNSSDAALRHADLNPIAHADWDWVMAVNVMGVVYGLESFLPHIRAHGEGGAFVNTASMAGMVSAPGMEPYSATKFAVVAMSEGWAAMLADIDRYVQLTPRSNAA